MIQVRWSRETPTEEGVYFFTEYIFNPDARREVATVFKAAHDNRLWCSIEGNHFPTWKLHGYWAGPVLPPTDLPPWQDDMGRWAYPDEAEAWRMKNAKGEGDEPEL